MMEVNMEVRCRQCPACLKQRSIKWTQRAVAEMSVAGRTWFGTLTLAPEKHTWVEAKLRSEFQNSGDFDALTEKEKFAARLKLIGVEVTLFIKRIRKNSGAEFKYILVAERHKSGLPHLHILLHEAPGAPIRKNKVLDRAWSWGFSKFALAETKHAYYVCKYLTKSSEARVRASLHYGEIDAQPENTL